MLPVKGTCHTIRTAQGPGLRPAASEVLHVCLQGTYLLLEKLRYAVYRRLLRKVHAVHGELEPEKKAQIPLPQFQMALAMQVGWGEEGERGR